MMATKFNLRPGVALSAIALAACASQRAPQHVEMPPPPEIVAEAAKAEPQVQSTILAGQAPVPQTQQPASRQIRSGNVGINLPQADVRSIAASVQELTGVPIQVDPGANGKVSLITPGQVARSELIGLFETALRAANLALVPVGEGYLVRPVATAQAPVSRDTVGFGTEVIQLQFINAEELRKVLDGALPGVVTAIEPSGNRITIAGTTGQRSSAHDLISQFDVNWLRNMSFGLFVPERTDARLIAPELNKLINANDAPTKGLVRLITMERLNGILAVSTQRQYLDDVQRWIEVLDRQGESAEKRIYIYRVQNGRARDLARTLNRAFGNGGGDDSLYDADPSGANGSQNRQAASSTSRSTTGRSNTADGSNGQANAADQSRSAGTDTGSGEGGRISSDDVNNAVVIFATPREYAVIEEALRRLDVLPLQVMIEAAITEVTLTDTLRYGVQWSWLTGDSTFRTTEGTSMPTGPSQAGFSYFLAGNNISAALNALEERTNIRVVSAPKLVTLNNQTAALQVGDQVPISSGTAVSVENPDAPIVNSIEYRDTGVILKVTPRVNAGGLVLLDISQEVSDVNTNASTTTTASSTSPTISTRKISTSVAVQDGQVIALGGLFRDQQTTGKNGVPILSRIPVLGGLFGTHNNQQNRTELIVLIKPHVIRTADDGREVTEELRRKIRTIEPFRTTGTIP